ncbi:hypothetical protein [Aquibium microcysteis]|uniref:hypothetical protein n=1 Tax=Aquibium microcysteis TaxID=675281 RepID=UPI00165D1EA2|nr:hypothetical protein [Aquibium microcysteis]
MSPPYIGGMKTTLPRLAVMILLAAPAPFLLAGAGSAQTVQAPAITGAAPRVTAPLVDRQIQESIARREAYQQLQQLQRQQDRDATRYRPDRLEVPVMKPSCTSSTYGSAGPANCR